MSAENLLTFFDPPTAVILFVAAWLACGVVSCHLSLPYFPALSRTTAGRCDMQIYALLAGPFDLIEVVWHIFTGCWKLPEETPCPPSAGTDN